MRKLDFDRVLEVIIEEYTLDGHEVIEQEGVYYARLPLNDGEYGVTVVTEQNLTRMADAIVRRASAPVMTTDHANGSYDYGLKNDSRGGHD